MPTYTIVRHVTYAETYVVRDVASSEEAEEVIALGEVAARDARAVGEESVSVLVVDPDPLTACTDYAPTYSVVTEDGTAMDEATLCAHHYPDAELRARAEQIARGQDDVSDPLRWASSFGNDAVSCVERAQTPPDAVTA